MDKLLTAGELAKLLNCSRRNVQELQTKRLIPYIKIGHLVRFSAKEVERALAKLTLKEHKY